MRSALKALFPLLALILVPATCLAWQGKVVGVTEGDLIEVEHEGRIEKIRLYGTDCPEMTQDFGSRARQLTTSLVFGKPVNVAPVLRNRLNQPLAIVTMDGEILNRRLVLLGYAWVRDDQCKRIECLEWKNLENRAKSNKIGLWAAENPVPPWEFAKGSREQTPETIVVGPAEDAMSASLDIQWEPSPDNNVVGYKVYWGTESKHYGKTLNVTGRTNSKVSIEGLEEGKAYFFTVASVDARGKESAKAPEISAVAQKTAGAVRKPSETARAVRQPEVTSATQPTEPSKTQGGKIPPSRTVSGGPTEAKLPPTRTKTNGQLDGNP